jgi:uncharacterized cupin superfamily protein
MAQLKVIKSDAVQPQNIRGHGEEAGKIKRIVATEKLFFNIDEVSPGYSPHHWHKHDGYTFGGQKVEYPADFEEIYYILSGQGVVQWKTDSGKVEEQQVGPGDTIHFPADVVEHQLLNNGSENIRLAVVGVPPPTKKPL